MVVDLEHQRKSFEKAMNSGSRSFESMRLLALNPIARGNIRMNPIARWSKAGFLHTVVLFAGLIGLAAHPVSSAKPANSDPCAASEYRQFDFWLGNWDVFDVRSPTSPAARIRVDRALDGCVLREDYQGIDGAKGQSFSLYDASRKLWHQG